MFTIYTAPNCSFCRLAKSLLKYREYLEIILDTPEKIAKFKGNTGFKTVPQIYFEDHHIGGYAELVLYLNKSRKKEM